MKACQPLVIVEPCRLRCESVTDFVQEKTGGCTEFAFRRQFARNGKFNSPYAVSDCNGGTDAGVRQRSPVAEKIAPIHFFFCAVGDIGAVYGKVDTVDCFLFLLLRCEEKKKKIAFVNQAVVIMCGCRDRRTIILRQGNFRSDIKKVLIHAPCCSGFPCGEFEIVGTVEQAGQSGRIFFGGKNAVQLRFCHCRNGDECIGRCHIRNVNSVVLKFYFIVAHGASLESQVSDECPVFCGSSCIAAYGDCGKVRGKKSRAGCGSDKLSVQVNLYEISAFPRQCNLLPLSAFT